MRHLLGDWERIQGRIQQARNIFLLLDYDGTLTPIVSRPELALCPPEVKRLLEELRDFPHVDLAVISGRALEDIRERVGISRITYIGNHGLSIQNPVGVHKKRLSPLRQEEFNKIRQAVEKSLGSIRGILLEDKGLILAVHYRNVARESIGRIHQVLEKIIERWKEGWQITSGKMVLEIRPRVEFDKGKVVQEILKAFSREGFLPIFLGDDRTDEDAFRVVKKRGITAHVGPGGDDSEAEYYLKDPSEVETFLCRFAEVLRLPPKG